MYLYGLSPGAFIKRCVFLRKNVYVWNKIRNFVAYYANCIHMKRIWNTFCEDISKNKGVKEMTFEKEIVKGFLQENTRDWYLFHMEWMRDDL